ncbi:uncharacterized protein [Argopecten irradians]|uniref:uncharacterized protein n=1 Tax=Argopecten irradians TaxID=31199 RepID=UPI003719BC7D
MGSQGVWTRWETEERKLSWAEIWKYTPWQLQFILRAVYDVLPTPTNLHIWGLVEDPTCQQCDRAGSLEHILSSCEMALAQGRYTLRPDQVLRKLADTLERERKRQREYRKDQHSSSFKRRGKHQRNQLERKMCRRLGCAGDWEMRVDLGKKLAFPEVVKTALRPDIVLVSSSKKKLVMVELTVPWETRCESAEKD